LCRFPEVEMALGKAGRAESAFDPAPLDMIETMVMFRPQEFWPRRKLPLESARRHGAALNSALRESGLVVPPEGQPAERELLDAALMDAMPRFDAVMREFAYQRNQEFTRQLRTELPLFLIRRTTELLDDRGQLIKPVASGDLAFIANSISAHVSEHLAMSLALEDLSEIARHTAAQLGRKGFLTSDQTVFDDRPGLFGRPGLAVRQWLGTSPPTLVVDLEKSGRARRDELWSGHTTAPARRSPASWAKRF
jgi:Cu(I)/Ag(I) efflux system membrane protein CusA/SilA